jgi:hypothetical protein
MNEGFMVLDSPVRRTKKNDHVFDMIRKQRMYAPQIKSIPLNSYDYDLLLDGIPEKERIYYKDSLKIEGITVRKIQVTPKKTRAIR